MQTSRSFNWYTRMWRAWITQPFNSTVTYGQLNMLHLKSVGKSLVVPYGGSNIFFKFFFKKIPFHWFFKKEIWFYMLKIKWTLETCVYWSTFCMQILSIGFSEAISSSATGLHWKWGALILLCVGMQTRLLVQLPNPSPMMVPIAINTPRQWAFCCITHLVSSPASQWNKIKIMICMLPGAPCRKGQDKM